MDARQTKVSVSFDGADISSVVSNYLLSMSFIDNEEDEADDLQIKLEDRTGIWLQHWLGGIIDGAKSSSKGIKILASIGETDCGEFELDEIKSSGPPSTVTIKGTSLGYSGIRKTKNDKAWEKYTLSGIQAEIAGKYGLGTIYDCSKDPRYARLEQVGQTDISFLKKLCQDAGYSLKIANGKIVIFDQRKYEQMAAVSSIAFGDGSYTKWSFGTAERDVQYAMCVVRYTNPDTGKKIEGVAYSENYDAGKSGNETLTITNQRVESQVEAESLAEKLLRLHNKFERIVSFTMIGSPIYNAGMTVNVTNAGYWSGKYLIKTAKHEVSQSGYTTTITLRKAEDIEEEAEEVKDEYEVGDVVYFNGGYHYNNSVTSTPSGGIRRAGPAIITLKTDMTRPHPYHLIGGRYSDVSGDCNVYGWVDAGSFS